MRTEHIKDGWWEMPGHLIGEIWPGTKNAKCLSEEFLNHMNHL